MANPVPATVREQIAWSYANLARAHAALDDGVTKYQVKHHAIRSKMYHGLVSGKLSMRSIYDDERLKMVSPQTCSYCGSGNELTVDHLIPRLRGGADEANNLILACRSCNSSKGGRDLLDWTSSRGVFPSILLLRRYLKLVTRYCETNQLMDLKISEIEPETLHFNLSALPTTKFPPLAELKLWVAPNPSSDQEL